MALTFRTFRARSGRDVELLDALRRVAAERVRFGTGAAVLCRTHDPEEMIWVGTQDAGPEVPGGSVDEVLAAASPAFSLRFLDGWYRLPAPPYQVWNLEVHAAGEDPLETLKGLLELSSWERGRPHVVGRWIYRAVEDPSVFIGFVGLTRAWLLHNEAASLGRTERSDRAVIWRPLAIVYQFERAPGGTPRASVGEEGLRPPFWARAAMSPAPSIGLGDPEASSVACDR
jgi:hypothetical protein